MATIEPTGTGQRVFPGRAPFTVDDLLKFPDDGNRYELINGSLLVSPAPTPLHQRAIYQLQRILDDALPLELEPLSTVNLKISDRELYIPDLVVVREDRVADAGSMFEPKDLLLAVEVASPSTRAQDISLKAATYAKSGIPHYWRVELDEGPTLYVHDLEDGAYGPPAVCKGGTVAGLDRPFSVSFDPADLLTRRK